MRKLMTMALALAIGTASTFAMNVEPTPKQEMRKEIVKLLDTPDFEVKNDITVHITFTFSSEGELVVLDVDSLDYDVRSYIRKNLNYKKMENPGVKDKLYSMPIKVKSA